MVDAGVANCQGDVASASEFDAGSFDPNGGQFFFSVHPDPPYNLGTTDVVLTVSDDQGHRATCDATVTVEDSTVRVIVF